jgi:hypothetical protein
VASSAARTDVYPPFTYLNKHTGLTEKQVDGSVACENPSLYAHIMASELYKQSDIRILSLGTTHDPFVKFKPDTMSEAAKYAIRGTMTKTMMAYTTDYWLIYQNYYLAKKKEYSPNYIRVDEGVKDLTEWNADKDAITKLEAAAEILWTENKDDIESMLQSIIDEKTDWKPKTT